MDIQKKPFGIGSFRPAHFGWRSGGPDYGPGPGGHGERIHRRVPRCLELSRRSGARISKTARCLSGDGITKRGRPVWVCLSFSLHKSGLLILGLRNGVNQVTQFLICVILSALFNQPAQFIKNSLLCVLTVLFGSHEFHLRCYSILFICLCYIIIA